MTTNETNEATVWLANLIEDVASLVATRLRELHAQPQLASPPQASSPGEDRLIKIDEAAERLGVSKSWLYGNREKLPFLVELGGALRVSVNRMNKFMETGAPREKPERIPI